MSISKSCSKIRRMTTFARWRPTCACPLARTAEAVSLLGDLFERQIALGDATRASLTYKKLARHGSPTWQQKVRFGQLLENSNKKLAIGTYENALDDLSKQRKKAESLQVLTRIVTLEPTQEIRRWPSYVRSWARARPRRRHF